MINLLPNPSFENGTYKGLVDEHNIPNDWIFHAFLDDTPNPHDPAPHARFISPEVAVLASADLPEHERGIYILHGDHTLKIAKRNGSWYAYLYQALELLPGKYTLTIQLFGNLVKAYDGDRKIWADDPAGRDGLVRIFVNRTYTDWRTIIPGRWNPYTHPFLLDHIDLSLPTAVGVEIMCPFPLHNNDIFADDWSLTSSPIPTEDQAVEVFRQTWRTFFGLPGNAGAIMDSQPALSFSQVPVFVKESA